jgi:hypothetical protein
MPSIKTLYDHVIHYATCVASTRMTVIRYVISQNALIKE